MFDLKKAMVIIATASQLAVGHGLASTDFSLLEKQVRKVKASAGLQSATSIIAIKGDKVIYCGNFGYADVASKVKATEKTPYYIASVTKPFTALGALIDINNKRLSADTDLATMFPDIKIDGIAAANVTVKDLLTHTSGIQNIPMVMATAYTGEYTPATLNVLAYQYSRQQPAPVGTFEYSNVGYNLYSIFADRYFENPWQARLASHILDPLSMRDTSATRHFYDDHKRSVARPYSIFVAPLNAPLYLEKSDKTMHAAGGMFASTQDLARFVIAQLNQGKVDNKQVFPESVIAMSQQKQVSTDTKFLDFERDGYAWGWYTGEYKGQRMLHHFGGFAGAHAHVSFMPEKDIGLVVLNNEDFVSARLTSVIADYIYGTLLDEADVQNTVTDRFTALSQRAEKMPQYLAKQQQKLHSRKMNLSAPISHYQGKYYHPVLGHIEVNVNAHNTVTMQWGALATQALGFDKVDQMRVSFNPVSGEVVQFKLNNDNQVEQLVYAGQVFKRS